MDQAAQIRLGGRIQTAQLDLQAAQAQRQVEFNLDKTLAGIFAKVTGEEGGDDTEVSAVIQALADPTKKQSEILNEILENDNKLGLDVNGDVFEAVRQASFESNRIANNTNEEIKLVNEEIKNQTEQLSKEQREAARKQFAQFTDFSDLGKNLRSVLAPTKGLTTDQLIERTQSAKTVDERLAQLGLSKEASSRAGLQRGIQEGGRLSGLVQVFDQLFPGMRNQNFRFQNAEQFAQQAAGFARRTFYF